MVVDLTGHTGVGVQLQLFYGSMDNRCGSDMTPPSYRVECDGGPGWYYVYIYTASGHNTAKKYTLQVTYP